MLPKARKKCMRENLGMFADKDCSRSSRMVKDKKMHVTMRAPDLRRVDWVLSRPVEYLSTSTAQFLLIKNFVEFFLLFLRIQA